MNQKVRLRLIQAAREDQPLYYGEIMKILDLRGGVVEDHHQLSKELADVSRYEDKQDRPLLSSMAIYAPGTANREKRGLHGNGFYDLAVELNKGNKKQLKEQFFGVEQMAACREFWRKEENYSRFANLESRKRKHPVTFFTPVEIDFLSNWAETVYDKSNPDHRAAKNYIMNTLGTKTQYWSNELVKLLSGFSTFNWRMWGQQGWAETPEGKIRVSQFKSYTWARIYKSQQSRNEIFFNVGVDGVGKQLFYKLDYAFGKNSVLSFEQQELVKNNIPEELKWKGIPVSQFADYDWDLLLEETSSFIAEHTHIYDRLINLIYGNAQPEQVFANNLRKQEKPKGGLSHLPDVNPLSEGIEKDYVKETKENTDRGRSGEELVLEYEKNWLTSLGLNHLVEKVEKVKDGLGYDIFSFDRDGNPKYIEVKTTTGNESASFYFTITEKVFAERNKDNYCIYRLYNYDEETNTADFFTIENPEEELLFQPWQFRVYLKKEN